MSIDRFGNTSGTSIPLTICDAYGGKTGMDMNLLMCGYGIGLSLGVVEAEINSDDVLPIVYTDEYYHEGGLSLD